LVTPNVYVPVSAELAKRKVDTLIKVFGSQHAKPWFRRENLLALMHLRGLECRSESGFAEAFHGRKLVFAAATAAAKPRRARQEAGR
jgi:hypothetical protein